MNKVIVADKNSEKFINNQIIEAIEAENVQEGEPFVILQTVAIFGTRLKGNIIIEKMIPQVI